MTRRWAVKMPRLSRQYSPEMGLTPWWSLVRSWLANRSEWRQRDRPGVARPVATVGHLLLVFPAATAVATEGLIGPWCDHDGDEAKPSSWGLFPGEGWLLIDFDRAWDAADRGWVGGVYYWRQERLGRRWAKL